MARNSIKMCEHCHALKRMRLGESDRETGALETDGRARAARLRAGANRSGAPDFESRRDRCSNRSAASRPAVERWLARGASGKEIHAPLRVKQGFPGHHSTSPGWLLSSSICTAYILGRVPCGRVD